MMLIKFNSSKLSISLLSSISCSLQPSLQLHTSSRNTPPLPTKPSTPMSYHDHRTPRKPIRFHGFSSMLEEPIVNETTVLETLTGYVNDWERAMEFFNWVESECGFKHTTETYNRMIDILGKFFEFDLAWQLIDKMRDRANHATFGFMFNRYASAHLVQEAISTYDKLGEFNLKDETSFLNLVDALCDHKHVIEAEELCTGKDKNFDAKRGIENSTKMCNLILRGWSKKERWPKCREFWEKMDQIGVCKDLHSYSIYMDIQCKCRKPWKAVKLYKEMKRKGIKPDVVAYNTAMHAIGISEGVDMAIRLGREMVELGCQPNVVTYNTVIKLLCENGRVREAYKVFGKMSRRGCAPNVITYHCIFRFLEKPNMILALLDRMTESGVRPRMDTYVLLMRKFRRWGFLRPVFIVWNKIKEHGLSPDEFAYNALIDALIDKGMIDMARKYDEEMLAKGLSAKPRPELVKGDTDDA